MRVPVVGFSAPSGTGKTTLLRGVVAELARRGLTVGVIKQTRDDFDVDTPGKDSHTLRQAGVERLLLASSSRSALVVEHPGAEPSWQRALGAFADDPPDLILVEGFNDAPIPRMLLARAGHSAQTDPRAIARVSDQPQPAGPLPMLDIDDPPAVAEFILRHLPQLTEDTPWPKIP